MTYDGSSSSPSFFLVMKLSFFFLLIKKVFVYLHSYAMQG